MLDRKVKEEILDKIGGETGSILQKAYVNIAHVFDNAEEIRIRAGLPLIVASKGVHYMITPRGQTGDGYSAYRPNYHEMSHIFTQLWRYSVYTYAEDIKNGCITR